MNTHWAKLTFRDMTIYRRSIWCVWSILAIALCVLGVSLPSCTTAKQEPPKIRVLVAASAADAVKEIGRHFTEETGVVVELSSAASSTLAQQIEQGAAADLFLSANNQWAEYLEKKGLAASSKDLLGNRLVVIVPTDSALKITKLEDLANADIKHLALGDPAAVPAGIYAKQALSAVHAWDAVKKKVVAASDVRQALAHVETAAAEAGIVYETDAAVSDKVKLAAVIPENLSGPIRYPLVLLTHASSKSSADSFYRYLSGPVAAGVFKKYGFLVLAETPDKRE